MMRGKSTLLTAIAAGIVFVSGMIILGKNPFNKKEQMKKDYVHIPGVEIVGSPVIEGVADASLKEISLKEASMKNTNMKNSRIKEVTMRQEKLSEEEKLLAMLQVVLVDSGKDKVVFNKKEAVRMRKGKQLALSYKGRHMTMTHNQKELYKIREPSAGEEVQIVNFEATESDKGG